MNINATLLGQMLTFAIFVWVTMKYIWPPIINALHERQKRIAEGLNASERAQRELELAQHKAAEQLRDAKVQAAAIIEQATQRANHIVEESKESARHEGNRLISLAQGEIKQETQAAREQLLKEISTLAVITAEKILEQQIDEKQQKAFVERLLTEI